MILAIVAAFVAGTLVTNAPQIAQAAQSDELIATLLDLVIDIETQVIALQTEVTQIELAEGPAGPQGETGDTGPQGPTGPEGAIGVLMVTERLGSEVTVVNLGFNSGESACLAGEKVVGGGFVTTSGTNELIAQVIEDRGSQADGKWFVTIKHDRPADAAEYKFKVQALCAKIVAP